ncbi:hypothetical protein K435DRAFT_415910 [Dendrothele bispora CBS 962.96]|uniref:DUF6593 domain-containing protein n=1 Tax=Dendrothele bispora (strain CBS 962.96) TaxID=1314807 RepID=A0A4S8MUY4_DENBC|nr:hypothetical protein K435DRAFT_415910 [Dendrothele bispora CBS 962.96]
MELTLSERRVTNTIFFGPNGSTAYFTKTRLRLFGNRKTKLYKGIDHVGTIQLHPWSADVVEVHGHPVSPHKAHWGTTSEEFVASDGRAYKWQTSFRGKQFTLYPKDHSNQTIARYDNGSHGVFSRSRPATLSIQPQGMNIADDIVVTFIYMIKRRDRRRAGGAAAAGASA